MGSASVGDYKNARKKRNCIDFDIFGNCVFFFFQRHRTEKVVGDVQSASWEGAVQKMKL